MAANTFNNLSASALIQSGKVFDKNGRIDPSWLIWLQQATNAINAVGGGNTGNTVVNTDFGVTDDRNAVDQEVADLKQQVNYLVATAHGPSACLAALEALNAEGAVISVAGVQEIVDLNTPSIVLADGASILSAVTDANANVDYMVAWVDVNATITLPNAVAVSSNTANTWSLVGPNKPGASQIIKTIMVTNNDTVNCNVSLVMTGASARANIYTDIFLQPGYSLQYNSGKGFQILNKTGIPLRH